MTYLRDEILVAYADAQLRGDELHSVRRQIANDFSAQRSILLFKLTGQYVRQVYSDVDFATAPSRVADLIEGRQKQATVLKFPVKRMSSVFVSGYALAACLALAVGIGATHFRNEVSLGTQFSMTAPGPASRAASLAQAIEKVTKDGAEATGSDGSRVVSIADFKDKLGNHCHELELYSPAIRDVPSELVVACRTGSGTWSIVGAIPTNTAALTASESYVPSEDPMRASLDNVLSILGEKQRAIAADRKYSTQ